MLGTLAMCRPFPQTAGPTLAATGFELRATRAGQRVRATGSGNRSEQLRATGSTRLGRRQFLQLSALGAAGAAAGRLDRTAHHSKKPPAHARHHRIDKLPAVESTKLASGVVVATAPWLIAENKKTGTLNWICNHVQPDHALEGFASQVSAVPGNDVALFINTTATAVQTQVYRMGYYQGYGGRLLLQTDFVPAVPQPAPTLSADGTVSCPWKPTMTLNVTKDWLPGCYLLKLVGSGGEEQFIPLTVRDDHSMASYVIQNSVTTWQAYNLWGDYSLYYGRNGAGGSDFASRARIVSFDRPYPQTWASGAADFVGNELPLLMHLESLGLDLTYWTDVDLHARPQLLVNHKCLLSLGHDEYWSQEMRQGAAQANAAGVNLAFLGANACYRQIRMEPSGNGPNRLQVCYKDAAEDPITTQNPTLTTVNWNQAPVNQPESTLIGAMYQSVGAKAPLVVTDASSWFYDGCNLSDGDSFPNVILGEYDRYVPALPGPSNLDVLAHSAGPRAIQLVRHHLLHHAEERWGRPRQRLRELRLNDLDDGRDPLHRDPRPVPRDHRRRAPGHGKRVRPLRSRSRHLLRQLRRELVRHVHRRRRDRGHRSGNPIGLSWSGTALDGLSGRGGLTAANLQPGVHDTTFRVGAPTIVPQTWAHPTTLPPERADRSRGEPWPPPDSQVWY